MGYFNNEIAIEIENSIKTDYRNGEIEELEDDPAEAIGDGGEPVGK